MARLSVALFGAPEGRHGRRIVAFPTRKAMAILAYLLVEGGAHRRDKLTALFWPESDEGAGRATLRSTLARLRDGLAGITDEPHLIIERDTVGFDFALDFELDLQDLRTAYNAALPNDGERPAGEERRVLVARLQNGVDAWRGEFLEGSPCATLPTSTTGSACGARSGTSGWKSSSSGCRSCKPMPGPEREPSRRLQSVAAPESAG